MNEPSLHDWYFERISRIEPWKSKKMEINESVDDRIHALNSASGHGTDEQILMEKALNSIAGDCQQSACFNRWLFEIWKQRNVQTTSDAEAKRIASEAIGNILGGVVQDIIMHEVSRKFIEA